MLFQLPLGCYSGIIAISSANSNSSYFCVLVVCSCLRDQADSFVNFIYSSEIFTSAAQHMQEAAIYTVSYVDSKQNYSGPQTTYLSFCIQRSHPENLFCLEFHACTKHSQSQSARTWLQGNGKQWPIVKIIFVAIFHIQTEACLFLVFPLWFTLSKVHYLLFNSNQLTRTCPFARILVMISFRNFHAPFFAVPPPHSVKAILQG